MFFADTKNRDIILQGEQKAEQNKWEQHGNAEGNVPVMNSDVPEVIAWN